MRKAQSERMSLEEFLSAESLLIDVNVSWFKCKLFGNRNIKRYVNPVLIKRIFLTIYHDLIGNTKRGNTRRVFGGFTERKAKLESVSKSRDIR